MDSMVITREMLAAKFATIFPHLDERQRRLLLGAEARALGHGGIRLVARAAGVREATVSLGAAELEAGTEPLGRARRPGGGRKRAADLDPGLVPALLALVEPDERGDPMSPLRWTTKSTRGLADELARQGHKVSADTVGDLLRAEGFSLQGNAKTIEGARHPDRDAQFRYISGQVKDHQGGGDPVISVDTKKKELVGEFKNAGREWRPRGRPAAVRTHDFPGDSAGKAVPYGVYDVTADAGWVNAGTDHDTAAFAVESIRRWWNAAGSSEYPAARRLLVTADAGGSNGYRTRAWKTGLAALAEETGLEITVCHFPPGTSKWNKIEHRLFSHITMNWRGRPLTSHDVIINSIAATTTRTGLTVQARLDDGTYPTGVKVSNAQMAALPISRHPFHGDWNYTLHPAPRHAAAALPAAGDQPGHREPALPELTGLAAAGLDELIAQLAVLRQAQREQRARAHPAGDARHKPRSGRPPVFPFPDRVVATVLRLRLALPDDTLAHLLGTSRTTMRRALAEIRDLLDQHGHRIEPVTAPPDLPARIPPYVPRTDTSPENKGQEAC
jgi:Rhodopirellula transposase DDE domain